MAQATTTTSNPDISNGNRNRVRSVPTAIEAITKISKILDQLSSPDRKRVLAFINESNA